MEAISAEMARRQFATAEEANAFLRDHFTGRKFEDILAEFGQPDTPRERALAILDAIPPAAPAAKARYEAVKALKEDPECLEAYLTFASLEKKPNHAARFLEEAIAIGRVRFADLIAGVSKENGLWGYHPARPFLNAMYGLASAKERLGRFDEAEAIYREILTLNPGDNQGVRYEFVTLLLTCGKVEEALVLIADYPDEPSCHWLFSRAFALFHQAWRRSGHDLAPHSIQERNDPEALRRRLEALPKDFDEANRALELALESYPFAVEFLTTDPELLISVESPDRYAHGSPEEVLLYAQAQGFLWSDEPIEFTWLEIAGDRTATRVKAKAARERHQDELAPYARYFRWER